MMVNKKTQAYVAFAVGAVAFYWGYKQLKG